MLCASLRSLSFCMTVLTREEEVQLCNLYQRGSLDETRLCTLICAFTIGSDLWMAYWSLDATWTGGLSEEELGARSHCGLMAPYP